MKHKPRRIIPRPTTHVGSASAGAGSVLKRALRLKLALSKPQRACKIGSNKGLTFSINTIPGTSSEVTQRLEVLTCNDDTGSKKLLITDNELHSSTIAVLGNDDLLIEILLRLPVLSLHLFKSVSKHWLSLITSPSFTLSRKKIPNIDPPAGLLILRLNIERKRLEYDFESFDIRIPSKRSTVFTLGSEAPPGYVNILQSCNGLLLCNINPDKLYVYNPTIKLFKKILTKSLASFSKMAFDPTKSPHYKVIHAGVMRDDEYGFGHYTQIETYYSKTGNWSVCNDKFPSHLFIDFKDGIYWNDAIHWLNIAYGKSLHCKLEIENVHPVLTRRRLPVTFEGKLLECGGSLLLLCKDDTDSRLFNVFEMKNGCSEWSVKYIVNLDDIMMPFPNTWRIDQRVWGIVSGEREEDSFMIIDLLCKVVQYNPVLKTVRTLFDLESMGPAILRTNFDAFQLIASFAGV